MSRPSLWTQHVGARTFQLQGRFRWFWGKFWRGFREVWGALKELPGRCVHAHHCYIHIARVLYVSTRHPLLAQSCYACSTYMDNITYCMRMWVASPWANTCTLAIVCTWSNNIKVASPHRFPLCIACAASSSRNFMTMHCFLAKLTPTSIWFRISTKVVRLIKHVLSVLSFHFCKRPDVAFRHFDSDIVFI